MPRVLVFFLQSQLVPVPHLVPQSSPVPVLPPSQKLKKGRNVRQVNDQYRGYEEEAQESITPVFNVDIRWQDALHAEYGACKGWWEVELKDLDVSVM
jgi:hypothetical protein